MEVTGYRPVSLMAEIQGKRYYITREWSVSNRRNCYFIDPDSLEYGIMEVPAGLSSRPAEVTNEKGRLFDLYRRQLRLGRPYGHAADRYKKSSVTEVLLTSDLCPTTKPYDGEFYQLITNRNLPVVVFFSGHWITRHPREFQEILASKADFRAGNHSLTHSFFDTDPIDLHREVLETEKILLTHGILPAPFFRFPGFRSLPSQVREITRLSLITLDGNIWMGSPLKQKGVLLVHSNGVVSVEVRMFRRFLKKHAPELDSKQLSFPDALVYFRELPL